MPTVSVIMNCWNCGKYLQEALDSIFAQTYRDFEVVFWDNLSADNCPELAQRYPIRFFRNERQLPLGESRNLAVEKAEGKYIAFLDCDDVWLSTKLEKQVALLESNSDLALVYSNCYIIDAHGNGSRKIFDSTRPHRGYVFNALYLRNFIPMPTVVARREWMPKFPKGFDIAEEYDVWLRMALRPFDYIEEPLAKYRIHAENASSQRTEQKVKEELAITHYWLVGRPWLKKLARRKRANLAAELAYYYFKQRKFRKFVMQLCSLVYIFPENLSVIPKVKVRLELK